MKHIKNVANKLRISANALEQYGNYKAKIDTSKIKSANKNGKLILVTSVNPTKYGEGKTTMSIGLAQALNKTMFKSTMLCLREPSLGPVFGIKGGATGGGKINVEPSDDINLHFTGDLHAITSAVNLIASVIDNHIKYGNELNLDLDNIIWKRALDINDASLRSVVINGSGHTRETQFQITASSEIMAILCLIDPDNNPIEELKNRLNNIIIGYSYDNDPIVLEQLNITDAIIILLQDAIKPNLVQTTDGTPTFIHCGPFANIAHGCNSLIATKTALQLADYVVTEAGFGSDLGAEKFLNIKCDVGNISPSCIVIVVSSQYIDMENIKQHIKHIKTYNIPFIITLNVNKTKYDDDKVYELIKYCESKDIPFEQCTAFDDGTNGSIALARKVKFLANKKSKLVKLYNTNDLLKNKIQLIVSNAYRYHDKIEYSDDALILLEKYMNLDYHVCISKNQGTLTGNKNKSLPIKVNDIKVCNGSKMIIVYLGNVIDMPSLSKTPNVHNISITDNIINW